MSRNRPATVLLVDDQAPFRRAAVALVNMMPGFEVVGEASSGEEAIEMADALRPDVVLMDVNLGAVSGIDATRAITTAHPDTVTVLISTYEINDLRADAKRCGAVGYIKKEDLDPILLGRLLTEQRGVECEAQ